ncbi:peptidoglycan-associated lipoprotein Pal [Amnimonas aquatica]|nr:peptidoglycan-associated lipoprotein Pal [Amnimonas aquatica]
MIKKTAALAAMGVLAVSVTGCSLFNKPKSVQTAPEYSSDTLPPVLAVGPTAVEAGKRKLCSEAELTRLFATVDPKLADLLRSRTYFFATDASELAPSAVASLDAHATLLGKSSAYRVQLSGHTDERGTHDYNLALGERRANAVARYLVSHGVASEQLAVVSYGKEKPVAQGHDESAWSKNRRVEVEYVDCKPAK